MKLIIATANAHYTEHDEIVGLRVSIEGRRPAEAIPVGAIAPTGVLTVPTPYEASYAIGAAMAEESCTACAAWILETMFPQIHADHRLVEGEMSVRGKRLEYELRPLTRRTMMG